MNLLVAIAALASMSTQRGTIDPAKDPHRGRYTTGTGRPCASCHDPARFRSADQLRAAQRMQKMVDDLNAGPLKPFGSIDCVSCHREGGPQHNLASPWPLDRRIVQRIVDRWPGDPHASDDVRRAMGEYSVSLGVACSYCHVPGNWKSDEKPAKKSARAMRTLMGEFPKFFELANATAFTCYTCHQGAVKVPR
jgi:hypothetical protein